MLLAAGCWAASAAPSARRLPRRRQAEQRDAAAVPADSLVATAPGGAEVWFTLARAGQRRRRAAASTERSRSAAAARAIPVPLLYTGDAPEIVNDTTLAGPALERLPPGRRLPGGSPDRPSSAGATVRRPALALVLAAGRTRVRGAHAAPAARRAGDRGPGRPVLRRRWLDRRTGWDSSRPLLGPIGATFHGDYFERAGDGEGALRRARLRRHGVPGRRHRARMSSPASAAGMGSPHSRSFSSTWGSLVGRRRIRAPARVVPAVRRRRRAGARCRSTARDGIELAAGLSFSFGGGGRKRSEVDGHRTGVPQPARGGRPTRGRRSVESPHRRRGLADSVVATATEAMGRPYEYGGTGEDGGGFDCSGLIQYAYGAAWHHAAAHAASTRRGEGTAVERRSTRRSFRATCSPSPTAAGR